MFKFFLSVIFLTMTVFSLSAQYSYMPGDPEIDMLLESYAAGGRTFPTSAFPLSKKDIYDYAQKIGAEDVIALLGYEPERVVIEEKFEFTYNQYFRTKEAWPVFSRLYLDPPDFANITLNAQDDDLGGIYIRGGLKREYGGDLYTPSNFFAFKSGNPIGAENELVREGYFYYLLDSLDLVFGRNRVHYGAADFSSLFPSKNIPFIDALSYKFALGNLQMHSYIATLENRHAAEDMIAPTLFADFGKNTIIATMHRFEYAWDKIRAGFGAQAFLVRENNGFQLGDFFPVFSWHNTVVGEHNMNMIADISFTPVPGLEIFLQGGVDDINAADLLGINDTGLPTIPAWVAGAVYYPGNSKLLAKATIEAGSTHYLWGNFYEDGSVDGFNDRNYFARAIYRYKTDSGYVAIPMTSPYGPGAKWYKLNLRGGELFGIVPELDFLYLSKNDKADLFNTAYERADSAMAAAPRTRTINGALTLAYRFADWNEIYVSTDYFNQNGTNWMEFTLGGSVAAEFRN